MCNYMEQVAKILGVELNEEFEVVIPQNTTCYMNAKFTKDGLVIIEHNIANDFNLKHYTLQALLTGAYSIKRKPWKPQYNEKYYSVGNGGVIESGTWLNDFLDIALYRLGNCYKTPGAAVFYVDKWKKFCESDRQIEI